MHSECFASSKLPCKCGINNLKPTASISKPFVASFTTKFSFKQNSKFAIKSPKIKMCTLEDFQTRFDTFMLNRSMEEHMAAPKPSSSSFFYRQNNVNKTLKLPYFHYEDKTNCGSRKDYPSRTGECFPETGPLVATKKVHRTKCAAKPASPNDVELPSHRTLHDLYTFKLKKRSPKKD